MARPATARQMGRGAERGRVRRALHGRSGCGRPRWCRPRKQRRRSGASGRADPDGNLQIHLGCKAPLDYSGYCNAEVDELISRERATLDPASRAKIFEQIAAHIEKDRPIVYLLHRHWLWAHTAKLTGLRTVPDGMVRLQGLQMK